MDFQGKKKVITDEERLELCKKLDSELEDFIDGLERQKYTDGWSEDNWEEEMEKHPFFMTSSPEDGQMSPLAEGLAKLKYDSEENTPLELAQSYKEDGNFNFKHKNYRMAILAYTEGIKVKCDDADINASLYNNRAVAHWYLKNYRSALSDSEKALKFNPSHKKACSRAAMCAYEIKDYDKCIKYAEQSDDAKVMKLLDLAKQKKAEKARNDRKQARLEIKMEKQKLEVIDAILSRGIKLYRCHKIEDIDLSELKPSYPGAEDAIVHIDDGVLIWPILFLYPEYNMSDLVKNCPENVPLSIQIEQLFPLPWDEKMQYNISDMSVYFEGSDNNLHSVDPSQNLSDILQMTYFEIKSGTPTFSIVCNKGDAKSQSHD